jgi:DNA polymerase-3 subunit gamma/tau
MESFVVSARKYRPATFDTVVGQGHITNTLKNAIKSKHLAQAFLFCGPRGVGKTTCARILAKTINCFNLTENTEACDQCDSCLSFNSGQSLNVFELDAASNNSVDDIRNLIEQVRFAPQLGKYKIYIIDEVHMLSQAAFNAFLKTLEEPPAHAIFILATTEKHKIIPTILSRCQIFDFNRIQVEDIASHLARIAKNENILAETDALHIIGQKADGGLRDALSMFDQIVSFAGNNLTYKAVIDNLNILDYDYYFKVTDNILSGNISGTLLIYNEILNNGFDGHNFINGLGEHFRNLLVTKDSATLSLLEVGATIQEKYKQQSQNCTVHFLIYQLKLSSDADFRYKTSKNARLLIELTLMQMCSFNANQDQPVAEKKNDELKGSANIATPKIEKVTETIPEIKKAEEPKVPFTQSPVNNEEKNIKNFRSNTSILSSLNKVTAKVANEDKPEVTKPDTEKNSFTQEELINLWREYAATLKNEKPSFHASLMQRSPELKDNWVIHFMVDSLVQQKEMNDEKINILTYLRRVLKNSDITLINHYNREETEKKPYTGLEKFKRMSEINPELNLLRETLDLDL